jgi:hypothetical protein
LAFTLSYSLYVSDSILERAVLFAVSDKICLVCSTENTSEGADGNDNQRTTPIQTYNRKKSRGVPVSNNVFTGVIC